MTLKDVISQAKTRGDIAVVLLAGTFGFVADAGLDFLNFIDPAQTGGVFSTSALGIKMAWEELTRTSRDKSDVNEKANAIIKLIESGHNPDKSNIIEKINTDRRLYELEIISLDEFYNALTDVINNVLRKQTETKIDPRQEL